VEALLFLAGTPLSTEEIAGALGMGTGDVGGFLEALAREYSGRGSAIEVVRAGRKWVMQVREDCAPDTLEGLRPQLPADLLKTAALIAYHQPIKQSKLVAMQGSKAYRHVTTLARMKLIRAQASGHTLELSTTSLFPEYFGLPAEDREGLRRLLAGRAVIGGGNENRGRRARPSPGDNLGPPLK
jgi:segregation and condensation protein B